MATAMTAEPPATPEEIWAILRETARRHEEIAERQKETDRIVKESAEREKAENLEKSAREKAEREERQREAARKWADWEEKFEREKAESRESWAEIRRSLKQTERLIKNNGKQMGYLNRSFGELAEHLVAPSLAARFEELGHSFESAAPGPVIFDEAKEKIKAQVDFVLENDDTLIAVEVKARAKVKSVAHHMRRLGILKEYREARGHRPKRILGAIAGAMFSPEAKAATLEAGFYAVEQSGDTMRITVPEGFVPRE